MLYLQADHTFFNHYKSEEASIEVMTRHVQRVNSIYRYTGMRNVVNKFVENSKCTKYSTIFYLLQYLEVILYPDPTFSNLHM